MILASPSNEKYNYTRITLKLKAEDKAKTSRSKNLENAQVTKEGGGGGDWQFYVVCRYTSESDKPATIIGSIKTTYSVALCVSLWIIYNWEPAYDDVKAGYEVVIAHEGQRVEHVQHACKGTFSNSAV